MTKEQASELAWSVAGGLAAHLGWLAVILLAFALIGMVRRA